MLETAKIAGKDELSTDELKSHITSFYDICEGIHQKLSPYLDDECNVEHLMSAYMMGEMTEQPDSEVVQEYLNLPSSMFSALSSSGFLDLGWESVVENVYEY